MSKKLYIHNEIEHNTVAAEVIVPHLVQLLNPKSVLDVGCGIGTWMSVFHQHNVLINGIDGDFVDRTLLKKFTDLSHFQAIDLAKPFNLNQRYDLAISLEVAEHLPPESAEGFVASIVKHADTVVFSAANKWQGGQNHLNEQYASYWANLFAKHGYQCYDLIRPLVWNQPQVDKWYKQNILVYSKHALLPSPSQNINLIHPDYWEKRTRKVVRLMDNLTLIRSGKAGLLFYLKSLFRSVSHFGKKYPM
ncbi:MAG: methyltransferase domain-containing protein [Bacteroidetes bacterium]|nr:MAG: methyltransferase domain-containing protein [Bacteroidota bacterium]